MATQTMKKRSPRSMESWDPFGQMRSEMARLWSEPWSLFDWPRGSQRGQSMWTPRVDMFERDHKLVVKTDLPGIKKEDVDVSMEEGDLVIRGERHEESESEGSEYYRMERSVGSFYRRIDLPFEVDPEMVQARFNNGVLEIEIERPNETRTRAQKIDVR